MKVSKLFAVLVVFSLLLSPLAVFPVQGSDPNDPDGDEDSDADGYDANRDGIISVEERYTNLEEYYNNTNPNDKDTDDGGAWDGWEVYYGFNPRNATDDSVDNDGDMLMNSLEFYWDTDPFDSDSDQDGMPDGWEDTYSDRGVDGCGLDPTDGSDKFDDPDNDGSDNLREYNEGTNPCDADSDDDGDPDGEDPPPVEPGEPPGTNPDTGATDGNVTIYEIFDPVLGTLKRWSSLDALYYDSANSNPYTMYNYDTTKTEIFPTNYEGYSQIFEGWIWMGIAVTTTSYTMIPSVSPDADIIDYDPNATGVEIRFFKDGADNYYVQSNEDVVIDLKYRMGTNGSYFNRPIPTDLTLDDLPEESIRPITGESEVKENVREFLQYRHDNGTIANEPLYWLWPDNGTPETNLALILNNLTWYFSAFIEGDGDVPDPEPPWDIYQSICINGIGACRHRSFGFFVTALALGAPTRYVSNEAHAFVEVYVPEDNETFSASHWKRINLGGTGSSNTLERPDDEGEEDDDTFNFDEMDPDDIDNMTGEPVTVVITSLSPDDRVDKGYAITVAGYVEDQNGTRLPNFNVGFGMWDKEHTQPIFEIGQVTTNESGNFNTALTNFLEALPGENEIYAASYEQGFLGVDGPEDIEVYSNSTLILDNPESVGKGQELIVSGTLLDVGGVPVEGETLTIWLWEDPYWGTVNCNNGWPAYLCNIGELGGRPTTDEFGNFVFNWTVPESGQPTADTDYHIYVSYDNEDEGYVYETSETTDLIILDSSVDLTAELEPNKEYITNKFWVNGTISDSAINNGTISVELAGFELSTIDVLETTWSMELVIPSDIPAGNYTVIVSFDSSSATLPDERVNLDFIVLGTSQIVLELDSLVVTRGEVVILEGELSDHLDQPLSGETVVIKWNDVEIATTTTETDGDFIFDYDVPADHDLGNVTWSAEFSGNDLHSGSSASQTSVVFQQTVVTVATDKIHFYPGESLIVSGSLSMDNGTQISGMVSLHFDEVYLESFTTNGTFSFEYTPDSSYIDVGLHVIEIRYSEKDYNLEDVGSTDVYLHRQVFLDIEEKQVLRDEITEIEGYARDESSLGIAGLQLSFTWGDNTLDDKATTEFGGSYLQSYLVPNAQVLGKVTVTVLFDNTTSPYYDNASAEVEFTVVSETVIHLPDVEIVRGEQVWFNGTIFDDRGQAVEEIEVNIFWDGEYLRRTTGDSNGSFSFECDSEWSCSDPEHPVGAIPVELDFGGFGYYLPSNYIAIYTIWGHTEIEITESSDVVIAGENVTFSGFIDNDLGTPLDREITILWNGITRTKVNSINGEFSGSFLLPYDTFVGNHTLTASVNDQNFLRGSSDDVDVMVMRETELTVQWLGGFRNSTSPVSGYLRDVVGVGLSNQELQIYFDDSFVGNVTTGDSGIFSYEIFIDRDTSLGPHKVKVLFEGSQFYTESSEEISSDIQASTFFQVESIEALRLQEFVISAYLVDDLNNPMVNQPVNMTFGNYKYPLITDSSGFVKKNMTLPAVYELGAYPIFWDYNGRDYYLPATQEQTLIVMAQTSISITMTDSDVLVGEPFSFSGRIVDDMGTPLETSLNFLFHGIYVTNLSSDDSGNFEHTYVIPHETIAGSNTITVSYVPEEFYLPSSSTWQLQVYHNIHIDMGEFRGLLNSTVPVTGWVNDTAGRPIEGLSVKLEMESNVRVDGVTDSNGMFTLPVEIPFGTELGYHNLTVSSENNKDYIDNSTQSRIFVQGETMIIVDIPVSLEYNQPYSGKVTLVTFDGSPVVGASLLIDFKPEGMTILEVTDSNGSATFESVFMGNATSPVIVEVIYTGDDYYVGSNIERTIVYRPPVQESNYALWIVVGAALVATSGLAVGWKWYRERHLREIQRILESTALAIEENMDFRESIVNSYKEMCKVLQRYGYLRRHFETVREFQLALQEALSLDHSSVASLTDLYENADYAVSDLDDDHKLSAVSALRTVIGSLDLQEEQNTR